MQVNRNVTTFIACESEYEPANIVIFGAPFDGTTSFRPGTRFAGSVIRTESIGIETYSLYQEKDLEELSVFDSGDLELPFGNAEKALQIIEDYTTGIVQDGKIPGMIGGEHLVTLGAVTAVHRQYPDLHIMQFDAHADTRDHYLGEKLSHATVMHRVWDLVGDDKIFQFGIRSGEREELAWAKNRMYTRFFNFDTLSEIIGQLGDVPVYVTIDLDVLDPSVFPGTGTPEPGGVSFQTLLNAVHCLSELNVVGFDMNELSPHYDASGVSTAVACKMLREILLTVHP